MTETTRIRELTIDETEAVAGGAVHEIRLKGVGTLQYNDRNGCWAFWHKGAKEPVSNC